MKAEILALLAAAVWTLAIALPSGGSRSEHQAEQQLCSRLAAQVEQKDVSLAEYLATRCTAKLLAGADKATESGGQR